MTSSREEPALGRLAALPSISLLLLLAAIVGPAAAQVPFLGKCPEKQVVQNFNTTAYLGRWYEQERYFAVFQLGGNCVTASYTDEGDGAIGVRNAHTNLISQRKSETVGKATQTGEGGEAKFEVNFPSAGNVAAPYWVLDTDYHGYAIAWSCTPIFGVSNVQFAWVLTRLKNPGLEVMTQVRDSLEQHHVEVLPFRRTLQVCDN